jgi:DNA-binding MarR family transcriptional regulator
MATTTMRKLASTFSDIRDISPEMPLAALVVFFECIVLAEEEHTKHGSEPPMIRTIAHRVGMPYQTVVRQLLFLSKVKEPGVEGLGWITTQEWPMDRRQKYVSLTDRGRRIVERLKTGLGL